MAMAASTESSAQIQDGPACVFLVGFMASGKTTVGRLLAQSLGCAFIDLDDVVEAKAGCSIAEIFAAEGEAGFRRREAQALRATVEPDADGQAADSAKTASRDTSAMVIATGGGAMCYGDNLQYMRANGLVIALTAPLEVMRERAAQDKGDRERPLMSRDEAELAALWHERVPFYRQAHACVPTEDSTVAEVVRRIRTIVHVGTSAGATGANLHTSIVNTSAGVYAVPVEPEGLNTIGEWAKRVLDPRCRRLAVVSDSNVGPHYGDTVRRALEDVGYQVTVEIVSAGEEAKSFQQFESLCSKLVGEGLDRRSAICALGGGVVGDLAGFVAASLYRGIAVIQLPTTLLAMVDAAIGGKTGINLPAGKNLVGAFWQPQLVLIDPRTLATLPARERRAAFGELLKYALLDGESLYEAVAELAPSMAGDEWDWDVVGARMVEVIGRCVAIKSWIVTRDEREQTGERALLNLGHTVGHGIEAAAGYGRILHGEAVALGLVAACRVSAQLGLCEKQLEQRVANTIASAGLDADLDGWLADRGISTEGRGEGSGEDSGTGGWSVAEAKDLVELRSVLGFLATDKKRVGGSIDFVTVKAPGRVGISEIGLDELARILRSSVASE